MASKSRAPRRRAKPNEIGLSLVERIDRDLPLTPEQAGEYLQISPTTVYQYILEGKIRRAGKTSKVLVLPSALRDFTERRAARAR